MGDTKLGGGCSRGALAKTLIDIETQCGRYSRGKGKRTLAPAGDMLRRVYGVEMPAAQEQIIIVVERFIDELVSGIRLKDLEREHVNATLECIRTGAIEVYRSRYEGRRYAYALTVGMLANLKFFTKAEADLKMWERNFFQLQSVFEIHLIPHLRTMSEEEKREEDAAIRELRGEKRGCKREHANISQN